LRLGVNGCKVRFWQHVTHNFGGLAGVDQVID
jgi:hypothetical protein